MEALKERRHKAENTWLSNDNQISKAYNKKLDLEPYVVELVLKIAGYS